MSTLWTPGGEIPVDDGRRQATTPPPQADSGQTAGPPGDAMDDPLAGLSEEERAQAEEMMEQLAEAREQIAQTPADVVVGNHAMGLYELGAIHLSQQPPNLEEARLAIDALGTLVDGLEGRLGEHEETLREALHQIRMAFVQVSRLVESSVEKTGAESEAEEAGAEEASEE